MIKQQLLVLQFVLLQHGRTPHWARKNLGLEQKVSKKFGIEDHHLKGLGKCKMMKKTI